MRFKWLWIILLILAILGVCALMAVTVGVSLFSITSVSNVTVPADSRIERIFEGNVFVQPDISIETTEEQTFLTGSEAITLVVENRFGDVVVQGKDTDQISMSVHKTAWGLSEQEAQNNLDRLTYDVIEEPGKITIRVNRPTGQMDQMMNAIDFKMDIPINTSVSFDTNNGDLYAGNLQGDVELETSFGNIEAKDIQGGEININNSNGEITLRGVLVDDFPITVDTEFGNVNIFQANASKLNVTARNGAMNLENVRVSGDIDLSNDFGDVGFRTGQATNLTVQSVNGSITLKDLIVEDLLVAGTDFGSLDLEDAQAAEYDLDTKNGKIELDGAENAQIKAVTDFGDLDLANVKSVTLDLETRNGLVVVRGSLAEADHNIVSDFGNITLRLPANQSINCDLKTGFGSITSEFDFSMSGTLNKDHWVGKINNGGGLLTVETQNGNITLEKSVAEEGK